MLTKTRLPSLQTFWQVYRGSSDLHTKIGVYREFQWQHKCSHSALKAVHLRWATLQELLCTWPFRSKSEITSTRACAVAIISDPAVQCPGLCWREVCAENTFPIASIVYFWGSQSFSLPANHIAGFIGGIGTNLELGGYAAEVVVTPWGS